jgi:hypothetical protein
MLVDETSAVIDLLVDHDVEILFCCVLGNIVEGERFLGSHILLMLDGWSGLKIPGKRLTSRGWSVIARGIRNLGGRKCRRPLIRTDGKKSANPRFLL